MNEKTYTLKEVLEAFSEGFEIGFREGKTRNIITKAYYKEKYDGAVSNFQLKLEKECQK